MRRAARELREVGGLECLGLETVGYDFMDFARGTTGFLSGAGGLMASSSKSAQEKTKQELLEKQRREEAEERAAAAAKRNTALGVVGAAVALFFGLRFLRRRGGV